MKPTKKFFFLFLFLLLFIAIYNVSHLFLSHFNTKTPFIGKKVRFGPKVHDQAFLLPIHFWLVFESVEGLALLVF